MLAPGRGLLRCLAALAVLCIFAERASAAVAVPAFDKKIGSDEEEGPYEDNGFVGDVVHFTDNDASDSSEEDDDYMGQGEDWFAPEQPIDVSAFSSLLLPDFLRPRNSSGLSTMSDSFDDADETPSSDGAQDAEEPDLLGVPIDQYAVQERCRLMLVRKLLGLEHETCNLRNVYAYFGYEEDDVDNDYYVE